MLDPGMLVYGESTASHQSALDPTAHCVKQPDAVQREPLAPESRVLPAAGTGAAYCHRAGVLR